MKIAVTNIALQVGLNIVTSAIYKSELQFGLRNNYPLLFLNSSNIFNHQRLLADGMLIPFLHKALLVKNHFMKKCICNKYSDILDYDVLKKRFKDTKNILSYLSLIAEHSEKEHCLYECRTYGQLWQRSLSWMDGNKQYAFKVPKINIEEWKEKPFVQPDDLFVRTGGVRQYLERATFEEENTICRNAGCSLPTIKLSVFGILHHMENIGLKLTLPDNNTWFPPFEKELVELTYERLSKLPNYKKYR